MAKPHSISATGSLERARLTVRCGPLGRALVGRFVAALGAETELPMDRVDEACLVAEAVADRCGELTPDGELELSVGLHQDRLELRLGPLEPGAVERVLRTDAGQDGGGAIRGLATVIESRALRSGNEVLRVVVGPLRAP